MTLFIYFQRSVNFASPLSYFCQLVAVSLSRKLDLFLCEKKHILGQF